MIGPRIFVKSTMEKKNEVQGFVEEWLVEYPIDYWWRKKFNVPFGSREHFEQTFINMVVQFEEEKLFKKYQNTEIQYVPGSGEIVNVTDEEQQKRFEELNLDDIDLSIGSNG